MKPLKKMISINKLLNKVQAASLFRTLVACMFSTVFAIPTVAHAQASACVAGETLQMFSFPAGSWTAGALTHAAYPVGAGANAVNLTFTIAPATGIPFTGGSPTQATIGNTASTLLAQHASTGTGILLSTQTLAFSRPVNKLRFVSMDVDSAGFQDVLVTAVNGATVPTSMVSTGGAGNHTINLATGTATAVYNVSCANTSTACNVTTGFNLSNISTAKQEFRTGPSHNGTTQYIGWNTFSWCLPAIDVTLRKTWVNATVNDTATVAASGATPALTSLVSVANTANETDATAVQKVLSGTALTLSETVAPAANYDGTLACTGNATALAGSTLTFSPTDTAIVCTYTNTRRVANLAVTKTDAKTTTISGDTNIYSIVVTNNGPLAANNAVVTDPGGVTGLTCSSVSCAAAGGAVCPAAPTVAALQSPGLTIPTLPNAGSVTLTLTCSVSATGV
jgi:uncharacterized repeat protein (TIGR01451 family)